MILLSLFEVNVYVFVRHCFLTDETQVQSRVTSSDFYGGSNDTNKFLSEILNSPQLIIIHHYFILLYHRLKTCEISVTSQNMMISSVLEYWLHIRPGNFLVSQ
jgi:hypothetical protein